MTENEKLEYISALLNFVKRSAERGATAAEVAALPAVAQVLLNSVREIY